MVLEFLLAVAGIVYILGGLMKEKKEKDDDRERCRLVNEFVRLHTDPELEERLKKQTEDPKMYNAIWDRIESYKRNNGPLYVQYKDDPAWMRVGILREPFRSKSGSLYGKTFNEEHILAVNRDTAVALAMDTYGKMTKSCANTIARNAPMDELRRWIEDPGLPCFKAHREWAKKYELNQV